MEIHQAKPMLKIDKDILNSLLELLGFHLTHSYRAWRVYDKKEYRVTWAGINSVFNFFEDYKIINIWNKLRTARCFYGYGNDKQIENPYDGCQSLEEALVKKELMYDGN